MSTEHSEPKTAAEILAGLTINAPDESPTPQEAAKAAQAIYHATGIPKRYREPWPRPRDPWWVAKLGILSDKMREGGLVALIGKRGTGKTRLAAECVRDVCPQQAHYTTAMGLFLRIRATYGKTPGESESDVIREISKIPLLVIDEIQERGGTAWEDRLLTHIIDKRYGAERATILIANLTQAGLVDSIGDSITSRLFETGGIIEFTGPSFRVGEVERPGQINLEFQKP